MYPQELVGCCSFSFFALKSTAIDQMPLLSLLFPRGRRGKEKSEPSCMLHAACRIHIVSQSVSPYFTFPNGRKVERKERKCMVAGHIDLLFSFLLLLLLLFLLGKMVLAL